ncbi:vesicle transport protein SFT2A isoform X1 [Brevipalpus obovatus]|uniref:vesicle transport protein SFT2A isoform X1 n=1 Tax=Brevipalpus obovatus TaxID=246614 RepID=UPI003D9F10C7
MDKLRQVLRGEDEGILQQGVDFSSVCPSMSRTSRIKWFLICFILGFVWSIIGCVLLTIPGKGLVLFAIFYTLGNMTSMSSTLFLIGPWNQLKKMFSETRWFATCLALFFAVLTLISGLYWKKMLLTVLLCIFQFLAMTWYSISYIPYARELVKRTATTMLV